MAFIAAGPITGCQAGAGVGGAVGEVGRKRAKDIVARTGADD
jgi:hypothetical protein